MQHEQLLQRAKALKIAVKPVNHLMQTEAAILDYQGQSELVVKGLPTSWINVRSQHYCDNKQLTKLAYQALDIPYPKSMLFQSPDEKEILDFFKEGQTYVCKPLDATNGLGIQMDIQSLEAIRSYYTNYKYLNTPFLLEEQIEGIDLRIHVLDGQIVAACIREPAFVLGNGVDSLVQLIEKRRAIMHRQNPANYLDLDEASHLLLREQNLSLEEVPPQGQKVQLKYVSNMAQGGIATDITESIHPLYHEWAAKLVQYLQTGYMGLDFITTNYHQDPIQHTRILEINARADWLHHTFSEGRTHDMATLILEALFF